MGLSSMVEAIHMLSLFRTCYIAGRFGGGKTSLGVWLAVQMVEQKFVSGICSNIPLYVGVEPVLVNIDEARQLNDTVIFIDEAWLELKQGTDNKKLNSWLAYLRKNNQYLILPSVRELARDLKDFIIERSWNFASGGIPLWWYQWQVVSGGMTKKRVTTGQFWIWQPKKIFKLYDHKYRPSEQFYYYNSIPAVASPNTVVISQNIGA